jgi:MFS family permease
MPLSTTAQPVTDTYPSPASDAAPASRRTSDTMQRRWGLAFGLYTAATNVTLTQAVWVIYLAGRGYSPFAIGLFEMCFHLAKLLAEVPTGIFADLVGRRASLIVACIVGGCAHLLFLVPTPPLIALDFALQGVSFAFKGGADSALLWTLAERSGASDRAAWYGRAFSRLFLVTLVAQTLGTASGGFLAGVNAVLPFLAGGATVMLGIPPLLLLPEQRGVEQARARRPHPIAHLRAGLRAVRADPALLGLLLLSGLTASVFTTVGYYTQLYFHGLGFSLAAVGVIVAVTIVPSAACAALAPRVMRRLRRRTLLGVFVALECAGLLALASEQRLFALVGYVVLLHVGDSILYPALSTYLNERCPEAQRATVLSLDTGLFSAVMIVLFPLFGLGLTHISYGSAYLWTFAALAGGSLAIAGGVALLNAAACRRRGAPLQ